eukprot:TRINITY_DN85047_c0_g1_i1.p1 TRINITY_DN85047_c0_g1~~TRINITY_DN85047_c0_g1_i1.p1  ORF type:complete len:126 (+),score=34.11 TRINITY_DN85047_c0_g1_i1:57-434(+)
MGNTNCCHDDRPDMQIENTVASAYSQDERSSNESKGFVITFLKEDGNRKDVLIDQRPMGIDFSMKLPMRVKRVKEDSPHFVGDGHAKQVRENWTIYEIDGKPLPDNFDAALKTITTKLNLLKKQP